MGMMLGHSESCNPRFGCNQCVIVRDQETKKKLPPFLKQALCLTVYEAKGLEFDDVILYNFFADSPCQSQWRILSDVEVYVKKRIRHTIEDELTINELDYKEYNKKFGNKRIEKEEEKEYDENEIEEYNYLSVTREREDVQRNFSLLCNDLKHLYVSITRPKMRLLIYDQNDAGRRGISNYWEDCDVVDVVRKGEEKEHPVLKDGFEAIATEADTKKEWRNMGIKLFRKKFYDAAVT
jgi:superfamily I DNA/RNA helicase